MGKIRFYLLTALIDSGSRTCANPMGNEPSYLENKLIKKSQEKNKNIKPSHQTFYFFPSIMYRS